MNYITFIRVRFTCKRKGVSAELVRESKRKPHASTTIIVQYSFSLHLQACILCCLE
jgi:hypothetical protein